MDYGYQNSNHLYAAPQPPLQPPLQTQSQPLRQSQPPPLRHPLPPPHLQSQPQPQPQQDVNPHLYSSYYSSGNPDPYPYQIGRHEDPSSYADGYAEGSGFQAADPYAMETGFEGQGVPYGGYQPYQHVVPYPYTRTIGPDPSDQAKRKFKIRSNTLDLESKKQRVLEGGAASDALRVCTVCNVVCNSDKVFAFHLAGEKHLLKALGRNAHTLEPNVLAHVKKVKQSKNSHPRTIKKAVRKVVQTFVCEVCKLDCNSQEALNSHKMGKKHKGKLLKLQQSIAPKPPAASADKNISKTTNGEAGKKTPSVKVGLQVKKERVLKCGALEDAIMECKICDVVCNSKSVYDSHVAGKKHLALVAKQQEETV